MTAVPTDPDKTRDSDLADWQAFCLAYYDSIVRALRLIRVPESEADDLAHSFLVKASEKKFLDSYRAFQRREAGAGRNARFRNYLYRSLQNHVRDDQRRRASRAKERSLSAEQVSDLEAAPVAALDPDAIHALDVLHQALQALRRHCERTGKAHLWVFFEETLLADEFRGRRARTRAELVAEHRADDPNFLDNSLTTAKRAFRRFVQEVIPRWPGDDLTPAGRFAEWMEALRRSNASQFNLLHVAYRVAPYLGDSSQADSTDLIVRGEPGASPSAPGDDELSILLSFRLEIPLAQILDASEVRRYVPAPAPFPPRTGRPLCLLSLIDPTAAESESLAGADVLGLLTRLKSMAKQLRRTTDDPSPELFAELIYTAVSVLALVRYGATIASIGPATLAENARWFLDRPWLDDRLRPLLLSGLAALGEAP